MTMKKRMKEGADPVRDVELLHVQIIVNHGVHADITVDAVGPFVIQVARNVQEKILESVEMLVAHVARQPTSGRTRNDVLTAEVDHRELFHTSPTCKKLEKQL